MHCNYYSVLDRKPTGVAVGGLWFITALFNFFNMSAAIMTSKSLPVSGRAPNITRTRPAFEKLIIGPIMVFGEAITGGHYMEVLRLGKQMAIGPAPSYWSLHQSFVSETGFFGAFYRYTNIIRISCL